MVEVGTGAMCRGWLWLVTVSFVVSTARCAAAEYPDLATESGKGGGRYTSFFVPFSLCPSHRVTVKQRKQAPLEHRAHVHLSVEAFVCAGVGCLAAGGDCDQRRPRKG